MDPITVLSGGAISRTEIIDIARANSARDISDVSTKVSTLTDCVQTVLGQVQSMKTQVADLT